jgi:hypothetical protein
MVSDEGLVKCAAAERYSNSGGRIANRTKTKGDQLLQDLLKTSLLRRDASFRSRWQQTNVAESLTSLIGN